MFGIERLTKFFAGVEAEKAKAAERAIDTFEELIDRLAAIELGGDGEPPSPQTVLKILAACGRTEQDVANEVIKRKTIVTLSEQIQGKDEASQFVRDAELELEKLGSERREFLARHEGRVAAANERLHRLLSKLSEIESAERALNEITRGNDDVSVRAQIVALRREMQSIKNGLVTSGKLFERHFTAAEEWPETIELTRNEKLISQLSTETPKDSIAARSEIRRLENRNEELRERIHNISAHQGEIDRVVMLQRRCDELTAQVAESRIRKRDEALALAQSKA